MPVELSSYTHFARMVMPLTALFETPDIACSVPLPEGDFQRRPNSSLPEALNGPIDTVDLTIHAAG